MRLQAIILAAGLVPMLAAAQAPTMSSVAAPKTTEPAKADEVVCKRFEAPTGSRIGKRQICRTKAQWDMVRDQDREAIEQALRKPFDAK